MTMALALPLSEPDSQRGRSVKLVSPVLHLLSDAERTWVIRDGQIMSWLGSP